MADFQVRERFVKAACGASGLSYGLPTRAQYLDFVAPAAVDPEELRDEVGRAWSCALAVLGLWRSAGVEHPLLERAYVPGAAFEWVARIAHERDAWRYPDGQSMPGLGDAVDVGQHLVAAVVEQRGQHVVETVEGGQLDAHGHKAILSFTRRLAHLPGHVLYLGSSRVVRWVDCTRLGVDG